MPDMTKQQALALLTNAVQENFPADELLEVYNEVFPKRACSAEEAHEGSGLLIEQLVEHIQSGLGIDVILDLWSLIFLRHRNVWYDEEEERIHYDEADPVPSE
jgi:hypothetical protein